MIKRVLPILLVGGIALVAGWWGRGLMAGHEMTDEMAMGPADGACAGGVAPEYWKAPMDPTYIRQAPGKSPMGMDLVPVCPASGMAPSGDAIEIDAQTVQRIGVRTETVARKDLRRSIRALGRIAYDETRVAHVHTKVQGWAEALHVDSLGQHVHKGQPLLEVYSPELVATQEELLLAARYQAATQDSPFEDVRGGGASLHEATRRRLELWDVSARDIDRLLETGEIQKTLTLYAPSSGIVTELGVRSGMEVAPNQNLYTIADVSTVWVRAEVYEHELPWLSLGQTGVVELAYLPGKTHSGPLTYISPFLDPKTRTAEVRLELSNPDGELRPEMFGNTMIQGAPLANVIAIPSEAVIRSGRRSLVIRALGAGRFEPRDVSLGMDSGDGLVEITDGLEVGDELVVSSQFLIDSESNLQEAVRKLLAPSKPGEAEMHEIDHEVNPPAAQERMMHEGMHEEKPVAGEAPMDHGVHSSHEGHGN